MNSSLWSVNQRCLHKLNVKYLELEAHALQTLSDKGRMWGTFTIFPFQLFE